MAHPDFSEFSFGYSITRHFETVYGGRRALPNFPTQPEEADGGFDVDFLSHGIPLFIQFKRSEIMTRRSATEYKQHPSEWSLPIYRMHLHGHNAYRQHYLMQNLEDEGNTALYITSQVRSKADLNWYYERDRAIDAARVFLPSEIVLPNTHERHHVSFNVGARGHRLYSETGDRRESLVYEEDDMLALLREKSDRTVADAKQSLDLFVDQLRRLTPAGVAELQRERRPIKTEQSAGEAYDELGGGFAAEEYAVGEAAEAQRSIAQARFYNRLLSIESVVLRAAIAAYHEADAFLVSIAKSYLD